MEKCLLAVILGCISANFSPVIQAPYYILIILLIFSVLLIYKVKIIGCYSLGFILCAIFTNNYLGWQVKAQDIAKDVQVTATVIAQTPKLNSNQVVTLQTTTLNQEPQNVKLRLNTYKLNVWLRVGDKIEATVRLKPVHGMHNEYSFDYVKWLVHRKIQGIGYIKAVNITELGHDWRSEQYKKIQQYLEPFSSRTLLYALLTGDKQSITQMEWGVLQNTGTVHLMVISGLHLSLIFTWTFLLAILSIKTLCFVFWVLKFQCLNRLRNKLLSQGAVYLLASMIALSVTGFFAWFSGFAIPTVRALIMLTVFVVAYSASRTLSWPLRFYIALLCVFIYDPFAPLSAGFWLSFSAVAVIIFALLITKRKFSGMNGWALYWRQFLFIQLALGLFLIPIQWLLLGQFAVLSFIANPVAIPWMSLTVIPLALIGLLASFIDSNLSRFIYTLSDYFLGVLWWGLSALSEMSDAIIIEFIPLLMCISLMFIILVLVPVSRALTCAGGLILGLLCLPITDNRIWKLQLFDVGQGLAVLFERGGHAVLYDTGAAYSSGFNMIDTVVLPYIKAKRLILDAVIVSHSDNDHAGGLDLLKNNFALSKYVTPSYNPCVKGQLYDFLQFKWHVLMPTPKMHAQYDHKQISDNNISCVIRVDAGAISVLLTGDIEQKTELKLVKHSQSEAIQSTLALVPHHGSNTSSTQSFIDAVDPQFWLLSRGAYSRFGHPHVAVSQRLSAYQIWDTAIHGQTSFIVYNDRMVINTQVGRLFSPWWVKI